MAASESKVFVITKYDKTFILIRDLKPRLWKRNDEEFAILTTQDVRSKLFIKEEEEYDNSIKLSLDFLELEKCNLISNNFNPFLHFVNYIVLSLFKLRLYNPTVFYEVLELSDWGTSEIIEHIRKKIPELQENNLLLICYLLLLVYYYIYANADENFKQLIKNLMLRICVHNIHSTDQDIHPLVMKLERLSALKLVKIIDGKCVSVSNKDDIIFI